MFCCFDVPSQYSPLDNSTTAHKDHNNASNNIVGYPGRRGVSNVNHGQPQSQWTPTRGNALSEYDPSRGGGGGGVNMNQNNVNGIDCCKNNDNDKGPLVSVTVPQGVSPGQTIHVTVPDGSHRIIAATIPPGMMPGSLFHVQCPPPSPPVATAVAVPNVNATPIVVGSTTSLSPSPSSTRFASSSSSELHPSPLRNQTIEAAPAHSVTETAIVASPVPAPTTTFPSTSITRPQPQPQQNLLLVQVPPGISPGTTLHVTIPGENRMVAAVVPPGVSEFHVAYTPLHNNNNNSNNNIHHKHSHNHSHHSRNNPTNRVHQEEDSYSSNMGTAAMMAAPLVIGAAAIAGMSMINHSNDDGYSNDYNYETYNYDTNNNDTCNNDMNFEDGGANFDFGGGDY